MRASLRVSYVGQVLEKAILEPRLDFEDFNVPIASRRFS
jgi:hypothetical protein